MWINGDVDLPEALITAQREGRLVVFAGAGVSMGPPSNLPSFEVLSTRIAGDVLTPNSGEALDAFLGRVELHGTDVQARTRAIIDVPTSLPRPLHERVVRLFANAESVRLVTTNFDRHFTTIARAIYPNIDIFVGPALPLGREASGVIYVHGAVERVNSRLVLTDSDFGCAYLADGWATRFLMEMFREFTVLFIGYSHQDLVMRYLARSFAGPTARFALTPPDNDEFWTNLGITPVHFPKRPDTPNPYGAIDDALQSWVTTATMGVLDHQARIALLVETPPTPDPEPADYVRRVLGSAVTLRFFIERAALVEWLEWVETEGFLRSITSTAPLTEEGHLLAVWFAEQFAVRHPRQALDFTRRHAATLNPVVCDAIAFRVGHPNSNASADTLRLWATTLLAIRTTPTSSLARLMRRCAATGDFSTTALLFRTLVHPQLRFEPPWPGDENQPLRLSVEVSLRGDEYDLRKAWQSVILPHLADLHEQLFPMVVTYLQEASALLIAAGRSDDGWDPMSFRRAAVEPHGQDHISPDWGLLVDMARELIDWSVAHDPSNARRIINDWSIAPQQLLVRLAIYGVGRLRDLNPNEALVEIEQRQWLYRLSYKHEVFELLARVFSRADDEAQRRFIEHSMTAHAISPEREAADADARRVIDYERYNVAVWLHHVAPDSTVATSHLNELQQRHPEFAPRDHPDMDRWISSGFVGPISPVTGDELLAMEPNDAAPYLVAYRPESTTFRGPDREGLLSVFEQTATAAVQWSIRIADALVARRLWTADVWSALLAAWRSATFDEQTWPRVLALVDMHTEIVIAAPAAAAAFLEQAIQRRDISLDDIERLEQIGERLLAETNGEPPGVTNGVGAIDWLTSAINHPAGRLAESWVTALGRRIALAGDQWHELPATLRTRFEAFLRGIGNNAVMGRIIFASQVDFLLRADRTWTETNIIPLFDWDADALRAAQVWDGFLTWGRWSDPLVDRLQPFMRQTFTRVAQLGGKQHAFASALASVAAFSTVDPWHNGGWLFDFMRAAPADARAHWADEFGRYMESLNEDGVDALWMRWLSDYWGERITGVPQPLDEQEKGAMVTWLAGLVPRLTEAIDRILAAPPTTLDHLVFYRLHDAEVGRRNGLEIGRLLRGLLPLLNAVTHDFGEVADLANQAADHGAEHADLLVIANEMARLGCPGAAQLRDRANS